MPVDEKDFPKALALRQRVEDLVRELGAAIADMGEDDAYAARSLLAPVIRAAADAFELDVLSSVGALTDSEVAKVNVSLVRMAEGDMRFIIGEHEPTESLRRRHLALLYRVQADRIELGGY